MSPHRADRSTRTRRRLERRVGTPTNEEDTRPVRCDVPHRPVRRGGPRVRAERVGGATPSEELFTKTCAGCHAAGGNIVQAGATLFPDDLKRNGVDDAAAVYDIIYGGKGKMPGYGEGCAPKGQCTFGARLADEDVKGLAEYVIERSAAEWK